jgi:hypothetical protein
VSGVSIDPMTTMKYRDIEGINRRLGKLGNPFNQLYIIKNQCVHALLFRQAVLCFSVLTSDT